MLLHFCLLYNPKSNVQIVPISHDRSGEAAQAKKSNPIHTFAVQAGTPGLATAEMWNKTSKQQKPVQIQIFGYNSHEDTHIQGQTPTCR